MSIQQINIGNLVNDGLGDDLRTAFLKVNANFSRLETLGTIQAINLTTSGEPIFKGVVEKPDGSNELQFKTLLAGDAIELQGAPTFANVVKINAIAFNAITTTGDSNTVRASFSKGISLGVAPAPGATVPDLEITSLGSAITVKTLYPFTEKLTNYEFGSISGSPENLIELFLQISNIDFGTVENPSSLNVDFGTVMST